MRKKLITAIIALTLALSCLVGVTVAWLFVDTDPVVNTFAPSNIELVLEETGMDANRKQNFQMVPGEVLTKDPKVTVKADIDCYVFVEVEKSDNADTFLTYEIDTAWTIVPGQTNVYYRAVNAADAKDGESFDVLADNTVTVNKSVTKEMMNDLTADTYPTMTFTAYAVQKSGMDDVADAWKAAQGLKATT